MAYNTRGGGRFIGANGSRSEGLQGVPRENQRPANYRSLARGMRMWTDSVYVGWQLWVGAPKTFIREAQVGRGGHVAVQLQRVVLPSWLIGVLPGQRKGKRNRYDPVLKLASPARRRGMDQRRTSYL